MQEQEPRVEGGRGQRAGEGEEGEGERRVGDEGILRAARSEQEAAGGGKRQRGGQWRVRQQCVQREREEECEERAVGLLLALQREELLGVSGVGGAYGPHGVADGGLHVRGEGGVGVQQREQREAEVLTQSQLLGAGRQGGPGGEEGQEEGGGLRERQQRRAVDELA